MSLDHTSLTETLNLAMDLDDRREAIEKYIADHNIDRLWTKAVDEAIAEAGVTERQTFYNAPYAQSHVNYELDMRYGTLSFSGYDTEGDYHAYTIPVLFLFPETRDRAIEELKAEYRAKAAKEQAEAEQKAAEKRAADEREFERLGRELGRI